MSKALNFQGPLRLAIAEGATTPNAGQIGSSVWSTTLNRPVWWTGSAWSAFAPPVAGIVESGSNANGRYIRFSDGTQLCSTILTIDAGTTKVWWYPAAFLVGTQPIPSAISWGSAYIPSVIDPGNNMAIGVTLFASGSFTQYGGSLAIHAWGVWK